MPLGSGFHIIPLGDLIQHEFTPDCVCGPAVTHEPDGSNPQKINVYFRHHALDGRKSPDTNTDAA